mmetsp:Transcript_59837/g.120098  ORF Transcript_59837/g.120098 Transcript_59837/m.120098 type:complete len:435 (+) Transcript_59837:53-1357(+)
MSFAEQIAEMFDVDSPEEAARLTITIIAIGIGISLIIYAISILCIAGEAICCLLSLVKCARYLCKCCVDCCGKMTGGSSSSKKEGEVETSSSSSSASPASGSSASRHNVGQLMSLVVMVFSILVALVWEFYFATEMDSARATQDAWSENCDESMSSYPQCLKYQAAYRVAFVATVFFASMSALTASQPAFHNQGWDLKIFCYLALLVGMTFAPNRVFDDHGFIWVARVGAFVFLLLQQVILIDSAYCVNEFLVEKGYRLQNGSSSEGEWNVYLVACLVLSLGLFASAVTGIVLLLVFYTGCDTSNTFISFTLLLVSAFTGLQLFATKPASEGEQGHNFLTSAVVAAYVVYLCFVAVREEDECRQKRDKKDGERERERESKETAAANISSEHQLNDTRKSPRPLFRPYPFPLCALSHPPPFHFSYLFPMNNVPSP